MIALTLSVLFFSCSAAIGEQVNGRLSLSDLFSVSWTADLDNQTVTFDVTAETTGFVGFGLSERGTMRGSDVIIGGVENGLPYFTDRHGLGTYEPAVDASQDYILLSASENATHTNLVFTRALDTGDADDLPIANATTNFIWSIGATDFLLYHIERGSGAVNILNP